MGSTYEQIVRQTWRGRLSQGLVWPMLLCTIGFILWIAPSYSQEVFTTKDLKIAMDGRGQLVQLYDVIHGRDCLAPNQPAPLVTLKSAGTFEQPSAAEFEAEPRLIRLRYEKSGVSIDVQVKESETHVTLEIVRAEPADAVDAIVWGPYPTVIGKTVGEVIGVVRDGTYALGIQSLNVKTLGGYPDNEEGIDFSRGQTAKSTEWGSVLQAFCMDRSRPRNVAAWNGNFPNMPVPPIPGETVVGSKIALFGCAEPKALNTIGQIEVAEGLPHPMINGVWFQVSPEKGRSYLISDYTEENIDEMLGYVQRANLMTLYHGGPFKSWGHYEFHPRMFPNGVQGMKECAEKAKAMGIRLGVHTLSNFIQTNDPYVTPMPDPRLAKTGFSRLTQNIDAAATEIPVASPEYFANEKANWMHTVVIDQELIRYRAVSPGEPWILLDCQRGAFATQAAAHKQDAEVGKLLDHPYKVFFPNLDLQREIAQNLAGRFNTTGLSQMDFDGHEGCLASGQGTYAIELFAKDFYDHLSGTVLNGTSNSSHFYWHINSYCNWGEPWYGGFRESMQEYRIDNQALFERNYMPGMLGWYLMTETTSLSDMEWMLARAAGYNAGFALATSPAALRKNPDTGRIMDAIREWESARRSGAFSEEQRNQMKNAKNEFHLEKVGEDGWNLYPFHHSADWTHKQTTLQPGQPTASEWEIENPAEEQPIQFKIRVSGDGGVFVNPSLELDNFATFSIPVELKAGQTLLCEGTADIRIYDEKGQQIHSVQSTTAPPKITQGKHRVTFDGQFEGDPLPSATVSFKTINRPEQVKRPA